MLFSKNSKGEKMDNQTNNNQMIEEIKKLNDRIAKLETKLDSNQNKQISNFRLAFEGIGFFFFGLIAIGPAFVALVATIQYIYYSIKNNVSFHYFYENLNILTIIGLLIILAIIVLLINKARIGSTKQTN
jgi:hypothetical protein